MIHNLTHLDSGLFHVGCWIEENMRHDKNICTVVCSRKREMRSLQVTETWNVMTSSLTWPGPETRKLEGLTIITGLPNCFSCAGCSWAGRDTFLISEDRLQVVKETSGPHVCSFSGGFSAWWWLNSIVSVTLTAITQSVVGCFSVWQNNRYTMTNPYLGSFPKLLCGYISPLSSSWKKKCSAIK